MVRYKNEEEKIENESSENRGKQKKKIVIDSHL